MCAGMLRSYLRVCLGVYSSDIAIGAPYEDGDGAVHMHYGSREGLLATSTQVIKPSDLGLSRAPTFGLAIGRGFDMDGNDYNGIVQLCFVHAYESSREVNMKFELRV